MPKPDASAPQSALSLCDHPRWRGEDLGTPLPDLPHANSVCLPTWRDVVEYEEKRPRVMERLRAGYPRFVVQPPCAQAFAAARRELCGPDEACHLYPTRRAAERAADRVRAWCGAETRVAEWSGRGVYALCYPTAREEWSLKHWRHTGDGISSRHAQALMEGRAAPDAHEARRRLQQRIAESAGVAPRDVYLFKSGMAAIYALHRALVRRAPGRAQVQFGFPYVDTLKILQDFGTPHVFYARADEADLAALGDRASRERIGGLFCEFPSNPTLVSTDLEALRALADRHAFPLVIDDTISTWSHVDLRPAADIIVTSLTKWFTGRGDVMGGSAVINPAGPHAEELRDALNGEYEDCTWGEAIELAELLSRDADERVLRAGATAEAVADWLRAHPAVAEVYYPKFQHRERYDRFRRPNGGYGGLFSFVLRDPERASVPFYDALELCKGPNLGTVFTLCCPFTLLAHYSELDWAERCGVSRWLLRLSVGQEEPGELIARLGRALRAATA